MVRARSVPRCCRKLRGRRSFRRRLHCSESTAALWWQCMPRVRRTSRLWRAANIRHACSSGPAADVRSTPAAFSMFLWPLCRPPGVRRCATCSRDRGGMKQPKVAILLFPGTNSEDETRDACTDAGLDARLVLWSEPPSDLRAYDAYILPGGFAYEDRVRAGAIAAKSASVGVVAEEARKGKLVLGLCNGAQVLAEIGLLGEIALARNLPAGRFQNQFVTLELAADPQRCA